MPFMAAAAAPHSVQCIPWIGTNQRIILIFWGLVVLLCLGLVNLLTAMTISLGCRFGNEQQKYLATRLFHGYLIQPLEWHFSRHTAMLAESLQRARSLSESIFRPLVTLMARGLVTLLLIVSLLILDPKVASLVLLLVGGLFSLAYFACRRKMSALSYLESQAGFRLATTVHDSLGALKQIQMVGREAHYVRHYSDQIELMGEFLARRIWIMEIPRILLHLLANAIILVLVIYLEATLQRPEQLIPIVSLYALAGYRLLPGLQLCLSCLLTLQASTPVLDALWQDLSHLPPQAGNPEGPPTPLVPQRGVTLRNLCYSYPDAGREVLSNLCLEIPVGTHLGIVGPSGRGKTTLLQVLTGLLEPTKGCLEVDGFPLSSDQMRNWRAGIGYVPQEVFLCDDTIEANVALGIPPSQICRERLLRALHESALEELTPQTLVGERGVRLSGGQRQRLGIARALYLQPHLLVLDEATNALDLATENLVLGRLPKTLTVIIVAHRESAVQNCQRVIQL